MENKKLILLHEEIVSLDNFKEICIYEDDNISLSIQKEDTDSELLKQDILDRYNNEEYWDYRVLKN